MVLIGSTALSYYVPGIVPNDIDLVGTYDDAVEFRKKFKAVTFFPINSGKSMYMKTAEGVICEIEVAWEGSRAEKFLEFLEEDVRSWRDIKTINGYDCLLPTPDVLYLLKMSHRYLKDSPHFLKTMEDIHKMRELGCVIRPEHKEFYEQRMKDTYTYKHPKLDVSKEGFFDAVATGVEYIYDHDSLHLAVKHLPYPAYHYYKPDGNEVYCDKEMFYRCPERIRLLGVLEEAYVLALERSLIPHPGKKTPKEAFDMALMKVASSITSGWFREYAWESYYKVQALYDDNYVRKFQQGLGNGTVKPFDIATATY